MPRITVTARLLILLGALCLVFPARAEAYLDPGAGSYMLQLAIATALAGSYALKLYWRRLWGAVGRVFGKAPQHDADNP